MSLSRNQTNPTKKPLKVAIIGGGIGGVEAARQAIKNGMCPTIFEAKPYIGGKCYTVSHPEDSKIITEGGAALVAHSKNYKPITQAMQDLKIEGLKPFTTKSDGVAIMQALDKKNLLGKAEFGIEFAEQMVRYENNVAKPYLKARDKDSHILPEELNLPFKAYADKHKLGLINDFEIPFVTGFGYGHMDEVTTYSVAEYMEESIIPSIAVTETFTGESPLRTVQGGFQHLIQEMGNQKGISLITSANINKISRSAEGVEITYNNSSNSPENSTEKFDLLIMTLSPYHWKSLGMDLTSAENACVEQVTFYPYTVGFVSIADLNQKDENNAPKALAKEQQFFAPGLDQKITGEMALFTTQDPRDNPAEGRFGTLYRTPAQRNMDAGAVNIEVEQKEFKEKIDELAKKKNWQITVHGMQTWQDYMSALPWKQRVIMDKEQMKQKTVYIGPAMLGGFESTGCVASQVDRTFKNIILPKLNALNQPVKQQNRFFKAASENKSTTEKVSEICCSIL